MTAPNAGAKAELIGTYLEILCYGIYLVVFYKCLRVLGAKYIEGRPTATLLCTAFTIFALVTVHLIMDILRSMDAFTSHMDVPNFAILYYTVVRRDLDLIKSGCYIAVTVIADGLIMYRTFIVWARNWKLALLPFLLVLADIATGSYSVWLLGLTKVGENALMGKVTNIVRYFYGVTLAVNLLCTVLISYKIWRVQREVDRYSPNAMRPSGNRVILIIVESAAIYSAMLVILIVTSIVGGPVMLAMLNVIAPCIGIVFSMVIVCVSVDRTRWDSLKISTHLNFVTSFNLSTLSNDPESGCLPSPAEMKEHITGIETPVLPYSPNGCQCTCSTASFPNSFS